MSEKKNEEDACISKLLIDDKYKSKISKVNRYELI